MKDVFGAEYVSLHVRRSNRAALQLYRDTLSFKYQHILTAQNTRDRRKLLRGRRGRVCHAQNVEINLVYLVEIPEYFSTRVLPSCLFMVHDTRTGSEHDVSKLSGRKKVFDPLFNLSQLYIETW